jgi:hypothetical protein
MNSRVTNTKGTVLRFAPSFWRKAGKHKLQQAVHTEQPSPLPLRSRIPWTLSKAASPPLMLIPKAGER